MTRVILTDEARADALEAFGFYDGRRAGLGMRFRGHVDAAIAQIQEAPEAYGFIYRDLRRKLVERFPYAIFYRVYPGVVVVVALMHGRQNPATWKRRAGSSESG